MNRLVRGLLLTAGCLWASSSMAVSVVFLNPGPTSDGYWQSYGRFMHAAAEKLDMSLEVIYTDRDTRKLLTYAREALQGTNRPDYLVFSNELNVAPEILRLSRGSGVKLFAVNNTLTQNQIAILGDLSQSYPDFIGSLVGNDEEAGYLTASQLFSLGSAAAKGRPVELLAFSGTNNTPVSLKREQGMYRALAEHPEVHLRQIVLGGWRRDRALEQARILLKRYPGIRLVWTANDQMAFGAMDAGTENGRLPGKDILFSSINWAPASLDAVQDGRLSVIAGGHFMLGGLAMVLLHDYEATDPGARHNMGAREAQLMKLLTPDDIPRIRIASQRDDFGIDVRQLSLEGKPAGTEYEFIRKTLKP
ncbi:ABC transporter substrate-binding protein [Pseudomonas sp. DSP3-2-2]|uniref:ABC transporter substrate-binding protein n=1 Tax=unclassified Pseudomonas TaxID=196821 RepID=UPI003CF59D68